MSSDIRVKICGLKEPAHVRAAAAAGATYVGFMFFEKSPRFLSIEKAAALALEVPVGVAKVAVTVDASNEKLDEIVETVPLDMLQLHGHESVERVAEVRARYGLPVMKVIGVAGEEDLSTLDEYGHVADQLMVDTKAPKGSKLPGGNGLAFDWRLIAGRRWSVPWMLAGGLNADNVAEAVRLTGARQVDVSSAVESALGVKDAGLIEAFVKAAQSD